jgi:hypothetical protein
MPRSPSIITIMESGKIWWTKHATWMVIERMHTEFWRGIILQNSPFETEDMG